MRARTIDRMRLHASLIAALVVVFAAPASAQATGWVTSGPLSPPDRTAVDPQVVLTPDGGRVIAWSQRGADGNTPENVSVRSAPPGGDFGAAQTFAGPFDDVHLATGADGTVALAWRDDAAHTVHIARRAPGQTTFTEATPLVVTTQVPAPQTVFGLSLVVTGGDAYLAYNSKGQNANSLRTDVWVAQLLAGSGAVQVAPGPGSQPGDSLEAFLVTATDPPDTVGSIQIAVDRGTPVAVWQAQDQAKPQFKGQTNIQMSSLDGARFQSQHVLATLSSTTTQAPVAPPELAAGGGHTYVAWPRDTGQVGVIDLANSSVSQALRADVQFQGNLHLGADRSGTLFAAWEGTAAGVTGPIPVATIVPVGAAPPVATRLGSARQLDDLAVAPDGTAVALPDSTTQTADVEASLSSAGGAFGPVEDVSGLQSLTGNRIHQAAAAAGPGGRVLALWGSADGTTTPNQRLHLSERDASPPAFGDIAVPATATVGRPVDFAAAASDNLSGVTLTWDFGDGTKASGATASHAFAAPGSAQVTVTATDGAGNSVSATRVVSVQAAPSGPPPVTTPPGDTPPPADRKAPAVSRVSLTHRRFRVGHGTTLRLTLSERATVSIAIAHGRTVRGTLVRKSSGPGKVSVAFSGKIGKTALRPGDYTATITATDAAGNRSKTVRVKFTVVK